MQTLDVPNLSVLGTNNSALFKDSDTSHKTQDALPYALANHKAFSRVFKKNELTIGLIAPFKGYPGEPIPNVSDLAEVAKLAENLGFAALWIRDVPFFDPNFNDVGQGLDLFVTLGYLASVTQNIALGTAGIISPLREPIFVAKGATSTDFLSDGRFILGLSSGDRPIEYPAFKADFNNRAERFRESWDMIDVLANGKNFATFKGTHYGNLDGDIDLVPKAATRLPMIAVGRARQELKWLANRADGWIWHGVNPEDTQNIVRTLAKLNDDGFWRPFGYANFIDLSQNPDEPAHLYNNIYLKGGSKGIFEFYARQRELGLAHVAMNVKPTARPARETLEELAKNVVEKLK